MNRGTMMELPLTIEMIAQRASGLTSQVEIVSRRPDRSVHRTTYGAVLARARRLARALVGAGIRPGDRVATLMWNHAEHLEAYFGIPLAGAVVHTLNLRLPPDEIGSIAADAKDRLLVVDEVLLPLLDKFRSIAGCFERILVAGATRKTEGLEDYEAFLASAPAPEDAALPALREEQPLGTCYSSGTTGKPKGVVYTHRSTVLHTLVAALPDSLDISRRDTLLPVVPMFHVNAWGLPYIAAMVGAKLVFPGPHLDASSLLELMEQERVTVAAGVPTIWLGIRDALEAQPRKLQPGVRMIVGGSAAPEKLIRDFDRLGLTLIHAWGMTETSPIGLVSRLPPEAKDWTEDERYQLRAKQGVPPPLIEVRVCKDAGEVPRDGKTSGEVQVRGPWVTARYANQNAPDRWTPDGFFCTGDVATVDDRGFIQLVDRMADLIKSGGEWIASQALENHLMGHPAVREAAVIGVPDPKWSERPLAVIAFKPGQSASEEELKAFVCEKFPRYWAPDRMAVVDAIPRTSAGKFDKRALRNQYRS
ncbi:MAG TPA: long-chain fatty acid--CoA ligase [Myxococcales bacterium]|nr:long-chain fatty acid--CoA ligase [Myxococcales bacterium]